MVNIERLSRNFCLGFYFFFGGVEYAIILPTLNGFLKSLDAEQYYLGIVLSAFSFSGLISAPIFGKISDKTRTSKIYIIIGNLFEIGGNILYFMSLNKYMVHGSRLTAGIGSGAASSNYGMISRTTTEEDRTSAFSNFLLLRQVGLVAGPAFNLFLNSLDFTIGPFRVNNYTSPGLLMAIIWGLHTILILLAYKEPKLDYGSLSIHSESSQNNFISPTQNNHESPQSSEEYNGEKSELRSFKEEFLREEVIVCLTANFLTIFSQCVMETALAPITELLFHWGGLQNSYVFGGGSIVVMIGYISLNFISKRYSDRALLLFGVIGIVFVYIIYTGLFVELQINENQVGAKWVFPTFITTIVVLTLFLPYVWVPQASIFSKVTSIETQAFNQGIRMVSIGIGQIIGPIWASSLVTLQTLPIMVGVNLLLNLILLAMVVTSYRNLRPINRAPFGGDPTQSIAKVCDKFSELTEEVSPLLHSSN